VARGSRVVMTIQASFSVLSPSIGTRGIEFSIGVEVQALEVVFRRLLLSQEETCMHAALLCRSRSRSSIEDGPVLCSVGYVAANVNADVSLIRPWRNYLRYCYLFRVLI